MKGFNQDTIELLCKECDSGECDWKYWTSEIYSFGKLIREYGFFPKFLPLYIYTDHGAGSFLDSPASHELESKSEAQFYHSCDMVKTWKKISNKPCYTIYSPFVFYRKSRKITQSINAKGTIAFPAHSTPSIDNVSEISDYIDQLKNLPKEFQPVSVCLHMHDINKGQHKIFIESGMSVVTAGNTSDVRFAERFYDILKNFKYSTSNLIGSYTYYSVEMGIPFSIYGNPAKYVNHSDPNIESGSLDWYNSYPKYKAIHKLFDGLFTSISDEQKRIVEKDLGLKNGISRLKMALVLYKSCSKHHNLLSEILCHYRALPFLKKYKTFLQIDDIKGRTRPLRRKIKAFFTTSKK